MSKRLNWTLLVDLLILVALLGMWYGDSKPVHAQLGGSNGFQYTHISTATNTQVKTAAGQLGNVTVNTTAAGAITIVDTSAANCTGGTTVAVLASSVAVGNYIYNLQTVNGICVTTGAASDVTVTWR